MFDALRMRLLRVMRVPPEPHPPTGAPGSVRVFRAGRNLYNLRLLRWLLGQAGALAGIVFSLLFLAQLERGFDSARHEITRSIDAERRTPSAPPAKSTGGAKPAGSPKTRASLARAAERWPPWIFPVIRFFEWVGVALYVVQIPLTYALVRLEYELRWYIVTDRSLRIRAGLATVQESTMSFANVQQVVVTQGPVQRLLGIADLRVQSAGGGGENAHGPKAGESLHTGVFHGVDNASEIRDLILERLRQFRQSGLGDPDERERGAAMHEMHAPAIPRMSSAPDALVAARELLQEARLLRESLR